MKSFCRVGLNLVVVLFSGLAVAQASPLTDWFQANAAWSAADAVTPEGEGAKFAVTPGSSGKFLVLTNAQPKSPHLRSKEFVGDSVVSVEYLLSSDAKAGIYLDASYRIQLDGPEAGKLGSMVNSNPDSIAPIAPAPSQPGVWHKLEARVRAARYSEAAGKSQNALLLEVKIDGVVVHRNTMPTGWCRGTETEWETTGGNTTIAATAGSIAVRDFHLARADFEALSLPAENGGDTNVKQLVDYVQQGADLFKGLGCIECHAVQRDDFSQKTGPNLFGLFRVTPRDREIAAGEGHRFTIKADRSYLQRSVRTPPDELAIAENGPNRGNPYLPAMPPILPTVASDAQIDMISAYLLTLNEPADQGAVVKLVKPSGLENYDPMTDRLLLLVDRTVRMQRGPMEGVSGRAIHVGLPNGLNYTFDPRRLAIVQLWQGGFLDMGGEFLNRGGNGLKTGYESREIKLGATGVLFAPLNAAGQAIDFSFASPIFRDGAAVKASLNDPRDLPARFAEVDAQFLGYERDSTQPAAAPAFKYRVGRNTLAARTEFADDGGVRIVVSGEFGAEQSFALNTGVLGSVKVSAGRVEGDRWILPAGSLREAVATGHLNLAPKFWHPAPSTFTYLRQPLAVEPSSQPIVPRGYTVESYHAPKDNYGRDLLFEALGIAVAPDGTVVVATRTAGIWRLVNGEWRLFAEGLFDSLGVQVEDEHGLVVVAGQKAELTRIRDVNGDGLADSYETMSDAFTYSGNYHAYMHGPVRDAHGDYMITLNLNDSGGSAIEYRAGGRYMGTSGGYRGWAVRVPAKGGFETYADGLRSPASLGLAPDGQLWYADNQGEFVGTSKLFRLKKGAFYGHPAGLVDRPGMTPASPEIQWSRVLGEREPAVVLFPQSRLANSPGNPAWDTTGGRFGPFGGQLLLGDQTQSNLMRVTTEKVGSHEQGAAINFGTDFESGIMRPVFLPDGSLLLGQTGRGWQAKGGHVAALQRVTWDGKTVAPAIHHVSAVAGGFELTLTVPVPATITEAELAGAVALKSWTYRDAVDYGSPELDERAEPVTQVTLNAERNVVRVTLASTAQPTVHPQQTARVYQLTLSGEKLWQEKGPGLEAFYTLYEFPN